MSYVVCIFSLIYCRLFHYFVVWSCAIALFCFVSEKTCGVTELNKEEIRACVVDILRLMLAPVLTDDQGSGSTPTDSRAHASEPSRAAPPTQAPTRRSHSPAVITTSTAAVPRYSGHPSYRYPYRPYQYQYYRHPYHHMHHHHHTHQQYAQHQRRRPTESNANQHNRHPTSHSYPSNCASCNMLNVDFVDTVHFKTVRGSTLQAHSSFSHSQHGATCPHRSSSVLLGEIIFWLQGVLPIAVHIPP